MPSRRKDEPNPASAPTIIGTYSPQYSLSRYFSYSGGTASVTLAARRIQAKAVFAVLFALSGVFLAYGVYRSAQVLVGPEEQVVVTRFGKQWVLPFKAPVAFWLHHSESTRCTGIQFGLAPLSVPARTLQHDSGPNLLIADPEQLYKSGIALERLQGFICSALNRENRVLMELTRSRSISSG